MKQISGEGKVNVQRLKQRCGKAGHVKATLLLSPLYLSVGEASQTLRHMAEPYSCSHSCCPGWSTDVQDDGIGKLVLKGAPQDQEKSFSMILGLIFIYVQMALLYLRPRIWTGLAEGSFWHAWQSWMEIHIQETEQTGMWWSRTNSTACLYNVLSVVTACRQAPKYCFLLLFRNESIIFLV